MKLVIAIDGPAGAGKSTVSRAIANCLGLQYLDTGAMYRTLALAVIRRNVSLEGPKLAECLHSIAITFGQGSPAPIHLDDEDVSESIRTPEVAEMASKVSAFPEVREEMVRRQQELVRAGGVVLEGRDATTVIAPNADLKVYLTASLEERARRRSEELSGDFHSVRHDLEARDHRDITRPHSPLRVAEGARVIDSANLTLDEVVAEICKLAEANPSEYGMP